MENGGEVKVILIQGLSQFEYYFRRQIPLQITDVKICGYQDEEDMYLCCYHIDSFKTKQLLISILFIASFQNEYLYKTLDKQMITVLLKEIESLCDFFEKLNKSRVKSSLLSFKHYCALQIPIVKENKIEESKKADSVNHPNHYGGDSTYEVIKVCEAWGLDKDAYLFNTIKYVARAGKKDKDKEIEDLEKALWYLQRKINNLKNK